MVARKLSDGQVLIIDTLCVQGYTHSSISRAFGVSRATIQRINAGKIYRNVGRVPDAAALFEDFTRSEQSKSLHRPEHKRSNGKFTANDIRNIRAHLRGGRCSQTEIAKRYLVSPKSISNIENGYSYAWVK